MKIASMKKEKPSIAKPSPNTLPNVAVNLRPQQPHLEAEDRAGDHADGEQRGHDPRPAPRERAVELVAGAQVQPLANSTIAGNAMPKQTSGMCTANDRACICRACSRYAWCAAVIATVLYSAVCRSPSAAPSRRAARAAAQSSASRSISGSASASSRCSRGGEVLGDRPRQPALAVAAVGFERLRPALGQLDERAPPVARGRRGARSARRPPGRRSSASSTAGARARRAARSPIDLRPFAIQSPEHRALREREAVLGAQAAHELAEREAQLGWRAASCRRPWPCAELYECSRQTVQFSCIIRLMSTQ